jgi:Helix-turn-helix domain
MAGYRRLGMDDRVQIQVLTKRGISDAEIARELRVHRSTVGRERQRNKVDGKYYYHQAQACAEKRQRERKRRPSKLTAAMVAFIEEKLRLGWSPQQIAHPALIAFLHPCNDLAFHAKHRGGGVLLSRSDRAKLTPRGPLRELLPDVGIRCFTHAAIESGFQKLAPVQHGGTLKEMVAGISDGLLRDAVGFVDVALFMRPRFGHNPVGLVSVRCGQFAVSR